MCIVYIVISVFWKLKKKDYKFKANLEFIARL